VPSAQQGGGMREGWILGYTALRPAEIRQAVARLARLSY